MDMSLKILMICPQFIPMVGGYERSAERLCATLTKLGHTTTVITERRNKEWPSTVKFQGFTVRRLWCIYRPHAHLATSLASFFFFLLIKGRHYDLFHAHQYGYHAALAALVGKLMKRPTVLKITSTRKKGINNCISRTGKVFQEFLAALHKQVTAYVCTSRDGVSEIFKFGIPPERVHLIPNGLSTDVFKPCGQQAEKEVLKSRLGIKGRLVVLYCGRLSAEKNPFGLLGAWSEVSRRVPEAVLYYVGDGPQSTALKARIAQSGLQDSVSLVGYKTHTLDWYRAADLFVLPSHFEGLSNSLLEAISCGLPVVSTRVSGSEELLEKESMGELVAIGDVKALTEAITKLLLDPSLRSRYGLKAREYAQSKFEIDNISMDIVRLYKQLIASEKRTG